MTRYVCVWRTRGGEWERKTRRGEEKDALLSIKPRVRGTTPSSASAAWHDHREISSIAWV